MTLDLSFLEVSLRPAGAVERPVNVYDILRKSWRETRVDVTLQFFLDPTDRHGLGTLVIDTLLLYAFRAKELKMMLAAIDSLGPYNARPLAGINGTVAAEWGRRRTLSACRRGAGAGTALDSLGTAKNGHPRRPLYVRADEPLIELAS